jgi:hypothetical protein
LSASGFPRFGGLRRFLRCWFPRLTRGRTFFLRRQEESSQRRRRPWVGAGCAGSLRYSVPAGAAELGAAPLRQSSPFSRHPLRCSAPPKGPERRRGSAAMPEFLPVAVDGEKGAKIKIFFPCCSEAELRIVRVVAALAVAKLRPPIPATAPQLLFLLPVDRTGNRKGL